MISNEKGESERRVLHETLNKRIFDLLETKKSQEVKTTKGYAKPELKF